MDKPLYQDLLEAGVHFGHMRSKWNPKMRQYIFMERKGIHIIDLNRTSECLERAALAMKSMARSGKKILFVATKKQAREIIAAGAKTINMPYVTAVSYTHLRHSTIFRPPSRQMAPPFTSCMIPHYKLSKSSLKILISSQSTPIMTTSHMPSVGTRR